MIPAWRPRGMVARLALVLAVALMLEFAGVALLGKWQERELLSGEHARRAAEQLVNASRVASRLPRAQRANVMAGLSIEGMALNWVPSTVITDLSKSNRQLARIRVRLPELAPELGARDLRLNLLPSDGGQRRDLLGALRLADGSFVTFRITGFLASPVPFATTVMLHLLLTALVMGIALAMTRALIQPLRDLASAADATGRGTVAEIPVTGPWEVQRVASAFSAMQTRLLQMMEDHAQALVAVSHDLRTPIQRMRLRTAMLDDDELREAMALDLADMEKFIASVVEYMRSGAQEEDRLVDLAAIAMTVADNAADAGAAVEYDGPDSMTVMLKPLALKRALGNLVENACRYADNVRIVLRGGEPILLAVEDDGPGIPVSKRAEAFLPFHRLNEERSRNSGGSGLGLAIVWKAVESFGGTVSLDDSAMGGLAARIAIPAPRLP